MLNTPVAAVQTMATQDATAASTQKLLDKEREKHRASKRAAKLAADQAKGLKQALETEKQKTAAAEERARDVWQDGRSSPPGMCGGGAKLRRERVAAARPHLLPSQKSRYRV